MFRRLGCSDTCEFQLKASESASRAADRLRSRERWLCLQTGFGGIIWSWNITTRNGLVAWHSNEEYNRHGVGIL
jgi:hypothetical protein